MKTSWQPFAAPIMDEWIHEWVLYGACTSDSKAGEWASDFNKQYDIPYKCPSNSWTHCMLCGLRLIVPTQNSDWAVAWLVYGQ